MVDQKPIYDHEHNMFREIVDRMKTQGLFTEDEFRDIIDAVLEEHRMHGYLSDDSDIEYLKSALQDRWSEVKEQL